MARSPRQEEEWGLQHRDVMPMDVVAILNLFDKELRINPPPETGLRIDTSGGLVREIRDNVCVIYSKVSPAWLDQVIADEVGRCASQGQELEWKIYGHDAPHDLGTRLAAHGLQADEAETLMAFDLAHEVPSEVTSSDLAIRRVQDETGLRELLASQTAVFARDHSRMGEELRRRLSDPTLGLYVAYSNGTPVAAGRLSLPPDRSFAGLWGGGTLPGFRKRGIYRALVAARASEARARGYRYLTVEARNTTSRPILERLGFVPLTSVVGWIFRPPPLQPT